MPVEKITIKKNEKITFKVIPYSAFKISDLKKNIPNKVNNKILIFTMKFPKIKLMGKKAKTRFANKIKLLFASFSLFIILLLMIP